MCHGRPLFFYFHTVVIYGIVTLVCIYMYAFFKLLDAFCIVFVFFYLQVRELEIKIKRQLEASLETGIGEAHAAARG